MTACVMQVMQSIRFAVARPDAEQLQAMGVHLPPEVHPASDFHDKANLSLTFAPLSHIASGAINPGHAARGAPTVNLLGANASLLKQLRRRQSCVCAARRRDIVH